MSFRRSSSLFISFTVYFLFRIASEYYSIERDTVFIVSLFFGSLFFYLISTFLRLVDNKLFFYRGFVKYKQISIDEITCIEAVTRKRFGAIQIFIGRSPAEDYYRFHMENGDVLRIDSKFKNRSNTVGRYINEIHNKKFIEVDEIVYTSGT